MLFMNSLHNSSFRDPDGFLFYKGKKLLRQVNTICKDNYDYLVKSGLYDNLSKNELLVAHKELLNANGTHPEAYKIIEPEIIDFISYPYEWCFSQLKDGALVTLEILQVALTHGMILKDASAYNIQFHKGKPVFIDTLSFEKYVEGQPWKAYRQFCQHFLAPLALMSKTDIRLNQLLKIYIDGIPLDLASKLLPFKTKMNFLLLMHIHLHAKAQKSYEHKGTVGKKVTISKNRLVALIQSLRTTVNKMQIKKQGTEWSEYYSFTNYDSNSFEQKKEVVASFVQKINPHTVWDLGANTGEFTHIASKHGANCIAFDIDPLAVELSYLGNKENQVGKILPLIMDLTNPSPAIGWNNQERMGMKERTKPDLCIALAILHHLAISNNLPFGNIVDFFSELSQHLVIEFVPKSDSQIQKLLQSRTDIFDDYTEGNFVKEFEKRYTIIEHVKLVNSERTIYWMCKK